MMLTSPGVIREFLGFDDMLDITRAIEAALESVTVTLAARLNTSFDRATATDVFYVEAPIRHVGLFRQTEFRLSRGFIQSLDSWNYASEFAHFGTSESMDASSAVAFDSEKGIVRDLTTEYTMKFVRGSYTYGFEVDADDSNLYDLTQVPLWLQEAAKLSALVYLNNNPSLRAIEESGATSTNDAKASIEALGMQLKYNLSEHARYAPLAQLPVM